MIIKRLELNHIVGENMMRKQSVTMHEQCFFEEE